MNGIEQKTESAAVFALAGAGAFALGGGVFGFLWTTLEAPYVMALQWALGAATLGWLAAGQLLAWREAVIAGIVYLLASMLLLFVALAVFEFPVPIAIAAGITGAVMGSLVSRGAGAAWVGLAALVGFAVGEFAAGALVSLAPAAIDTPGTTQALWFALAQAVTGAVGGAAIGYGFARAVRGRLTHRNRREAGGGVR